MREKFNFSNKRQRVQARKFLDKEMLYWRTEFFLKSWVFRIITEEERTTPNEETCIHIVTQPNPVYKQAAMHIWFDTDGDVNRLELEEIACHEMLHVALSPISMPWEKLLKQKITRHEMDFVTPLLHAPEEGVCEDLAFILVDRRNRNRFLKARLKGFRPKKGQ